MLNSFGEVVEVQTLLPGSVGEILLFATRIHRLMHIGRVSVGARQARWVARGVEGVTLWCLSAVAAVCAGTRKEGWFVVVRLALARVVRVVVWCWVRGSARTRLDVAVDVAGMGIAEAGLSVREVSGPELGRLLDDVGVVSGSVAAALGLGEDAVVCCVDRRVVVEGCGAAVSVP